MNSLIIYSFLLLVVVNVERIQGNNLPPYIIPCSRTDPKLNECATRVAKASSQQFAKGDKDRGIISLDPLFIKEINAINSAGGGGLRVVLKDVTLTGPSKMEVKKVSIDYKNLKVTVKAFGDILLDSDYDMNGRLLIIPIVGKGKSKIALYDSKITYTFFLELVKGKDGKEYGKFKSDTIAYKIGRAHFKLDNLFNGDKLLGENTNRLLNDSWKEVIDELAPPAAEALRHAVAKAVKAFLKLAPFDEILLP